MRPIERTALIVLLGVCLAAAGCGSDEEGAPIPAESAAVLQNQLNSVESRINGSLGACEDVTEPGDPNTTPVQDAIDGLPGDVDQDVRDALQQGFDRLFELVEQRCAERQEETDTETTPEPAPETDTETETETDTTDTTDTFPTETEPTTPTDTTEEPTTPTVPEEPSDGEGADGQGGGSLFEGDNG